MLIGAIPDRYKKATKKHPSVIGYFFVMKGTKWHYCGVINNLFTITGNDPKVHISFTLP